MKSQKAKVKKQNAEGKTKRAMLHFAKAPEELVRTFENALMPDAKPFEPMPGRAMRGYVEMPRYVLNSSRLLRTWLTKGMEYTPDVTGESETKEINYESRSHRITQELVRFFAPESSDPWAGGLPNE